MLRSVGKDAFGNFRVTGGPCTYCGSPKELCVKYGPKSFDLGNIDPARTILRDPNTGHLGILCGCYGKFHRQVAHIRHKMGEEVNNG